MVASCFKDARSRSFLATEITFTLYKYLRLAQFYGIETVGLEIVKTYALLMKHTDCAGRQESNLNPIENLLPMMESNVHKMLAIGANCATGIGSTASPH